MRVAAMLLILLNAALATVPRPQPVSDDLGFSCCRGSGPDAYCCRHCCQYWNCFSDRDCH